MNHGTRGDNYGTRARLEHDSGGPHVVERGLHRRVRLEQRLQDLEPAVAHLDVVVARGRVELLDDGLDRLVRARLRVRVRLRLRRRRWALGLGLG